LIRIPRRSSGTSQAGETRLPRIGDIGWFAPRFFAALVRGKPRIWAQVAVDTIVHAAQTTKDTVENGVHQCRGSVWGLLAHFEEIVAPEFEDRGFFACHHRGRAGCRIDAEHFAPNPALAKVRDLARQIVGPGNHRRERALHDYNHGVTLLASRAQGFAGRKPSFVHEVNEIGSVAFRE
jgi:hypothetical protein